jgi:phosphatidylserine/phosphatidylglycerophosphate/cardiolipin synthase-like enzyme
LISPAAAVRLITTILPDRFGTKPPPALGRIAGAHPNFRMRYLCERNEFGAQQTQIHAKVFIADNRQAYVGSANLTETSLIHNLELGLLVEDTNLVTELRRVFLDVYENFAKPFS